MNDKPNFWFAVFTSAVGFSFSLLLAIVVLLLTRLFQRRDDAKKEQKELAAEAVGIIRVWDEHIAATGVMDPTSGQVYRSTWAKMHSTAIGLLAIEAKLKDEQLKTYLSNYAYAFVNFSYEVMLDPSFARRNWKKLSGQISRSQLRIASYIAGDRSEPLIFDKITWDVAEPEEKS